MSRLTVPPLAPPLDDAADDVPLALELAPADEELDELPQAASTIAAMTVSRMPAAGLMCLFTDPPPQRS
jgi:hypothetical protein